MVAGWALSGRRLCRSVRENRHKGNCAVDQRDAPQARARFHGMWLLAQRERRSKPTYCIVTRLARKGKKGRFLQLLPGDCYLQRTNACDTRKTINRTASKQYSHLLIQSPRCVPCAGSIARSCSAFALPRVWVCSLAVVSHVSMRSCSLCVQSRGV